MHIGLKQSETNMKIWLWVNFLLILGLSVTPTYGTMGTFGAMIRSMTNRRARDFLNYGNYCGMKGSGPMQDDIDRCCREHDLCLYRANRSSCRTLFYISFYVLGYDWTAVNGRIICSPRNWGCAATLCECDARTAECFAENQHTYDETNKQGFMRFFNVLKLG